MPNQKSTNTTSRSADTAMRPNIHFLPNMLNLLIICIVAIAISVIDLLSILNIYFTVSFGVAVTTIFVVFILASDILRVKRRFPQQPTTPTNPPSAYIPHQTLSSTSPITTAVWSPDGQTLACASTDKTVHLWHAETGTLLHTLPDLALSVIWSPDGQQLATNSLNGDIHLWHTATGKLLHTLSSHQDLAWSIAWSPDGQQLASGSLDRTVCLWNTETGELLHKLSQYTEPVITVAWSPDAQKLASGSLDNTICLWNVEEGSLLSRLSGHKGPIVSLFWSLDGQTLTSLSHDDSIRLWKIEEVAEAGYPFVEFREWLGGPCGIAYSPGGLTLAISPLDRSICLIDITKDAFMGSLEGHTNPPSHLAFSSDGQSLASFAFSDTQRQRGTLLIWRKNVNNWVKTIEMPDIPVKQFIAFHPELKAFATLNQSPQDVVIWRRDDTAIDDSQLDDAVYYRNAKVVLVGDSGVGKSGLGIVLMQKPFEPTESTHARHIWKLYEKKFSRDDQYTEIREILLWDLAGQPGYRLIHQLHLDEVTIALIVFDARSETDPFAGVFHWERALQQAQCVQGKSTFPLKKFLVAARVDRGGVGVSDKRIEELKQKFNFERYFQTSAKTGREIVELKRAITETIVWEELPGISSTQLFQKIKSFLVSA